MTPLRRKQVEQLREDGRRAFGQGKSFHYADDRLCLTDRTRWREGWSNAREAKAYQEHQTKDLANR